MTSMADQLVDEDISPHIKASLANEDLVVNMGKFGSGWRVQISVVGIVLYDETFKKKQKALDAAAEMGTLAREKLDALV